MARDLTNQEVQKYSQLNDDQIREMLKVVAAGESVEAKERRIRFEEMEATHAEASEAFANLSEAPPSLDSISKLQTLCDQLRSVMNSRLAMKKAAPPAPIEPDTSGGIVGNPGLWDPFEVGLWTWLFGHSGRNVRPQGNQTNSDLGAEEIHGEHNDLVKSFIELRVDIEQNMRGMRKLIQENADQILRCQTDVFRMLKSRSNLHIKVKHILYTMAEEVDVEAHHAAHSMGILYHLGVGKARDTSSGITLEDLQDSPSKHFIEWGSVRMTSDGIGGWENLLLFDKTRHVLALDAQAAYAEIDMITEFATQTNPSDHDISKGFLMNRAASLRVLKELLCLPEDDTGTLLWNSEQERRGDPNWTDREHRIKNKLNDMIEEMDPNGFRRKYRMAPDEEVSQTQIAELAKWEDISFQDMVRILIEMGEVEPQGVPRMLRTHLHRTVSNALSPFLEQESHEERQARLLVNKDVNLDDLIGPEVCQILLHALRNSITKIDTLVQSIHDAMQDPLDADGRKDLAELGDLAGKGNTIAFDKLERMADDDSVDWRIRQLLAPILARLMERYGDQAFNPLVEMMFGAPRGDPPVCDPLPVQEVAQEHMLQVLSTTDFTDKPLFMKDLERKMMSVYGENTHGEMSKWWSIIGKAGWAKVDGVWKRVSHPVPVRAGHGAVPPDMRRKQAQRQARQKEYSLRDMRQKAVNGERNEKEM